jgi:hypothetical protein
MALFSPKMRTNVLKQEASIRPVLYRDRRTVPDLPTGGLISADSCNEETLSMAAGALLSLAFSYIPGLQGRYAARILYDLVDRSLVWLTKCAQPLFVSSFFDLFFSFMDSFSDEFLNTLDS